MCDGRPRVKAADGAALQGPAVFCTVSREPMGSLWSTLAWIGLCLGVAAAGAAAVLLAVRARIMRRVRAELGKDSLLLAAAARVGAPDAGASAGILMLLSRGLYFHAWLGGREVYIPGPSISWIGVSEGRSGPRAERHHIVVRFLNGDGKEDGITVRLLYPEQWVAAIKTHLITRAS